MPVKAESEALASYWLQQIEAWPSSGQTQQAYCKTNALSYHRFGYWRRKFRQQSQEAQNQKGSGFVPVTHSATSQSAGLSLAFPNGRPGASWHCGWQPAHCLPTAESPVMSLVGSRASAVAH